jgi:hypothetical protein
MKRLAIVTLVCVVLFAGDLGINVCHARGFSYRPRCCCVAQPRCYSRGRARASRRYRRCAPVYGQGCNGAAAPAAGAAPAPDAAAPAPAADEIDTNEVGGAP